MKISVINFIFRVHSTHVSPFIDKYILANTYKYIHSTAARFIAKSTGSSKINYTMPKINRPTIRDEKEGKRYEKIGKVLFCSFAFFAFSFGISFFGVRIYFSG
jgi:hypothetical protein